MALTKEDLQAIGVLLDSKIEPINKQLDTLQGDVAELKGDVAELKGDVDVLKGDVSALKADMAHHNHTVEPQLKIIREGLEGWSERSRQIDRHESKLENHGDRILALEYAFKVK